MLLVAAVVCGTSWPWHCCWMAGWAVRGHSCQPGGRPHSQCSWQLGLTSALSPAQMALKGAQCSAPPRGLLCAGQPRTAPSPAPPCLSPGIRAAAGPAQKPSETLLLHLGGKTWHLPWHVSVPSALPLQLWQDALLVRLRLLCSWDPFAVSSSSWARHCCSESLVPSGPCTSPAAAQTGEFHREEEEGESPNL